MNASMAPPVLLYRITAAFVDALSKKAGLVRSGCLSAVAACCHRITFEALYLEAGVHCSSIVAAVEGALDGVLRLPCPLLQETQQQSCMLHIAIACWNL